MRRPIRWFGIQLGAFWLCEPGGWGLKEACPKLQMWEEGKALDKAIARIQKDWPNARVALL